MYRYLILIIALSLSLWAEHYHAIVLPVGSDLKNRMIAGGSWHEGCPVSPDKLRYIVLDFYDLQHHSRKGELIVHEDVADEVVAIFGALYRHRFPIAQMRPVSDFNASDEASMRANNTSAFNCRYISGTTRFSNHSYGRAIDINPLFNPCIQKGKVSPANAGAYCNRSDDVPGMIHKESAVVKIFKQYGWKWGGEWRTLKDYQHFEKRR